MDTFGYNSVLEMENNMMAIALIRSQKWIKIHTFGYNSMALMWA